MKKTSIKLLSKYVISDMVLFLILLAGDQILKYVVVDCHIKNLDHIIILPGFLEMQYLENAGSSFGLLEGQKWFFISIAFIIICILILLLIRIPVEKHFIMLRRTLIVILTGIFGNMLDRIFHDGVIDFVNFVGIRFPIFNLADVYITISTIVCIILLLFVYKEKDFSFLYLKSQKYRELK